MWNRSIETTRQCIGTEASVGQLGCDIRKIPALSQSYASCTDKILILRYGKWSFAIPIPTRTVHHHYHNHNTPKNEAAFTPQPFGLEGYCRHGSGGRAGGRAGGCQTCGTHISVTALRIFSIRSSVELSRPVVVHCHGYLPICSIWDCPWAKNLSNFPQIGSRLCGSHISGTTGWIYPI